MARDDIPDDLVLSVDELQAADKQRLSDEGDQAQREIELKLAGAQWADGRWLLP